MPRHAQPKAVEKRNGNGDGDACPEDNGSADDLGPAAGQVEEWGTVRELGEERHAEEDSDASE